LSFAALQVRLGHEFRDPGLLEAALTHRSAASRHNERLEFLGDAVLGFTISAELYERFPRATEGDLTRLRASLVREETVASLAQGLDIGSLLHLGHGERLSGGHRRASLLADALEAVFGAIFLDAGVEASRRVIGRLYEPLLAQAPAPETLKDSKTRLQEWLQGRSLPLPVYELADVSGPAHQQAFRVLCRVAGLVQPVTGEAGSRRKAEQEAARAALSLLEQG
jgi:ribonuclease-3